MKNAAILFGLLSMAITGARAQQEPAVPGGETDAGGRAEVRAEIAFAPVLHIQLGSGATSKNGDVDVVNIEANTARNYRDGISRRVGKHLEVFSMGTGYAVDAEINAPENVRKVFALALEWSGKLEDLKNITPHKKNLYTGGSEGSRELEAFYRLRRISPENTQVFNDLLGQDGKPKTYRIDITYVIVPL